ncbi:MAG: hypothetical protein GXO79_07145, partial [Chlorobi bacterium]|nr:hypothetical protein [Chlorobiota bacterium]
AFTIIELLVTMVLSSIVVATAIYVFITFNNLLFKFSSNNMNSLELIQLQQIMKSDFILANEINYEYGSITLIYNNGTKVYYDIENKFIIRDAKNSIDTFNIESNDVLVSRQNENRELINEIIIEIQIENLDFPIHLIKEYPQYKLIEN